MSVAAGAEAVPERAPGLRSLGGGRQGGGWLGTRPPLCGPQNPRPARGGAASAVTRGQGSGHSWCRHRPGLASEAVGGSQNLKSGLVCSPLSPAGGLSSHRLYQMGRESKTKEKKSRAWTWGAGGGRGVAVQTRGRASSFSQCHRWCGSGCPRWGGASPSFRGLPWGWRRDLRPDPGSQTGHPAKEGTGHREAAGQPSTRCLNVLGLLLGLKQPWAGLLGRASCSLAVVPEGSARPPGCPALQLTLEGVVPNSSQGKIGKARKYVLAWGTRGIPKYNLFPSSLSPLLLLRYTWYKCNHLNHV